MPSLEQYQNLIVGNVCSGCFKSVTGLTLQYCNNQQNGWDIEGFSTRQWLYVDCPSCCYQTSLKEMGYLAPIPTEFLVS